VREREREAGSNNGAREIANFYSLSLSHSLQVNYMREQVMNTQYAPKLIWCVLSPLHVLIIREGAGVDIICAPVCRSFNNSEQRLVYFTISQLEGGDARHSERDREIYIYI